MDPSKSEQIIKKTGKKRNTSNTQQTVFNENHIRRQTGEWLTPNQQFNEPHYKENNCQVDTLQPKVENFTWDRITVPESDSTYLQNQGTFQANSTQPQIDRTINHSKDQLNTREFFPEYMLKSLSQGTRETHNLGNQDQFFSFIHGLEVDFFCKLRGKITPPPTQV